MNKSDFTKSLNNLEQFFFNYNVEINFSNFLIAVFLSLFLSYLVKITYIKTSNSLNDKQHFSEIFIPLAIVTTLVITVVKVSLALSLGLVGALSIVRFRAAIKEPEELVFLFFIIGIGLSNGANQYLLSIVATLLTLTILYVRKLINDKNKIESHTDNSTNILQIQSSNKKINFENIFKNIKKDIIYLKLKSYSVDSNGIQYNFWFDVNKERIPSFLEKINKISSDNKQISIQLFSRSGIYE